MTIGCSWWTNASLKWDKAHRLRWHWEPDLPRLGWYLVDLTVRDQVDQTATQRPIARTLGALLWMPEARRMYHGDEQRFAFRAEDMPESQWPLLPQILQNTGVRRLVVGAWDRDTKRLKIEQRVDLIEQLLQQMTEMDGRLTLSLYPIPHDLIEADNVNTRRPIEVLQTPLNTWRPFLVPILMRHSQRVHEWQLGLPQTAQGLFDTDLPNILANIHEQLSNMAPHPKLIVPWRLDHARRADLDQAPAPEALAMSIDVPPSIAPEHIPEHLEAWQSPAIDYRLTLRTEPADRMAHPRRVRDLALRMIYSWQTPPTALQFARPWTAAAEQRPAVLPDPLLGVFTNVAHQLAGRRIVDELPIGDGLKCYILDGPAVVLVAWNMKAPASEAKLDMFLGDEPMVRDVWGNSAAVPLKNGRHQVTLSHTPVFITGIDPELVRFRASFRVEPSLIESRQVPHDRTITLTNPWSRTISGHMQMLGPPGWQHQPTQHFFSIAAGDTVKLPVRLRFPIAEVAGPKTLCARFEFTAEDEYRVEMSAPMRLGLPGIGFDATVALEASDTPGVQDAVVACVITNRSDEAKVLYVFANLVGHPRQERLVLRLEPGQSVVRRFRFQDAAADVRDHPIRCGVREANGPAILNKRLSPNDAQENVVE